MNRSIAISRFKAECLGLLDEVAEFGEEILITRRGRPLARVVPVEPPPGLAGSVRFMVSDDELVAPIDAAWEAEAS